MTRFYNSCDIVGDIAIIRVTESSEPFARTVAETIMNVHKNVKIVLAQTSSIHGDFRLRKLHLIAGEDKPVTVHRESGCSFAVDVEKCYFSPRPLHERMRIARQVEEGEVVLNMFAGAGSFSIIISRHANPRRVYSVDINSVAIRYLDENCG